VNDGLGADGVEEAGKGRLVRELDPHGPGPVGRKRVPVCGHDVQTSGVEEGGEAAPQEPPGARHEDAQG
jgi:hypothetical protein